MELLVLAILFVYLLAAVVFDVKKRIIPNFLNYSMWLVVVVLGVYFNQVVNVLLFGVTSFIAAYLLYKLGVWAGGDAKLYVAICATLPLLGKFDLVYLIYVFIVSALVCIPVIGALNASKVATHLKDINLTKEMLLTCAKSAFVSAGVTSALSIVMGLNTYLAVALFVLTFFVKPHVILAGLLFAVGLYLNALNAAKILLLAFFASLIVVTLFKFFVLVQKHVLREEKKVRELKEGDVPAFTLSLVNGRVVKSSTFSLIKEAIRKQDPGLIEVKGKVLCDSTYAGGVSKEQIECLKNVDGLHSITIRKSIAFAPALAVAYFVVVLLT